MLAAGVIMLLPRNRLLKSDDHCWHPTQHWWGNLREVFHKVLLQFSCCSIYCYDGASFSHPFSRLMEPEREEHGDRRGGGLMSFCTVGPKILKPDLLIKRPFSLAEIFFPLTLQKVCITQTTMACINSLEYCLHSHERTKKKEKKKEKGKKSTHSKDCSVIFSHIVPPTLHCSNRFR